VLERELERDPLLAFGLLLERELLLRACERELLLALGLLLELLDRLLLAFGLLVLLLALARLELEDFFAVVLLEEVFVSPFAARSLFTVRAAISAARPFWPRFS